MRRSRIDSNEKQIEIIQKSFQKLESPAHIRMDETDYIFFQNVIDEFSRSEWTAHTLELAAMLAKTMADMERESNSLRDEGSVLHSERGTPVANPRKTVLQMHASSVLSLRRSLSLHARAQGGEANIQKARRTKTKEIEDAAHTDDDLIARPDVH